MSQSPSSAVAISAEDLARRVGTPRAPCVIDVRRAAAFAESGRVVAGAHHRDHREAAGWAAALPPDREIVVYCAHGHEVGQSAAALLRAEGRAARYLRGGFDAFVAAGGTTVRRRAEDGAADRGGAPSRWVTRERPKVDRIACPWFIRRFVDPGAAILYVAADRVTGVARETGAEPFDIEGVAFSHHGEGCSFDAFLDRFGVEDPALHDLATIVRGADTARPELAPQCAGLLAMSLGLSALHDDDQAALAAGMTVYDTLYAWLRHARAESHDWVRPASVA